MKEKRTKGTLEQIELRRGRIKQILEEVKIKSHLEIQKKLEELYNIEVSIPTLSRDFQKIKAELVTDEEGIQRYVLSKEEKDRYNTKQLTNILSAYTTSRPMEVKEVLAIPVKSGYADFVGEKIMEVYPKAFIGYLTSNKLLLLLSNNSAELLAAKKYLEKMFDGEYITPDYGMPISEKDREKH